MLLRGKLGLLVGVPVTGALLLATLVLAEAWRDAERATALGSVEHLQRVAERSTTLVRALQAERTSAVLTAASRERVAQGSLLPGRIASVDSALAAFRESVEKLDRKLLTSGTDRAVKMTVTQLAILPEVRGDIGSGGARGFDRLGTGYGTMVEALIALVTSLREVSSDKEIAADVATLVSLLRVDEQEARLDALLGLVFSVGEFPPGSFRKLVAITTEAKVHSATLQVDAGEVTRARFNASLTSGPGQEVSAIVAAALASVQDIPKVDPNHWYVQHGQQITTLRQLEDRMLARIASRATQKKAERQRMVLLVLIVAGLAVPGSLALGWKVARSVHLSLASLHAVANRVRREGDFSARVVSASADEVGQLGDAWNEMMAGIQARDRELADHRRHLEETVSQRTADLASERQRLALILTSVNEGIVGLDPNGCVTFLNPAAERLLGLTASDTVGRPFHEVVQHEMGEAKCVRESCPILRTLNDGSLGSLTGDRLARSNGVPLVIEGSSTPIVVEGRTAGAVLSLRDVTAQKNLEFQLQQARKLETIGQLAAGIAHEINTPMQFIGDNVRFLQEAVGDMQVVLEGYRSAVQGDSGLASEVRQSLEQLEQDKDVGYLIENVPRSCESALMGVARVSKIVYAMKEFSHSGGEEKELADLNRATESTATVATSVWKHVAELELHLEADLPTPPVHLGEINQVILNLIINAAHAIADVVKDGGAKGRITVSTGHDDTHVEIRVADTGTGIPESARDRIFTPFFTTKEIGKGTGQGLSLARSVVVDRHHGTIAFETETGRGTTFIVRLPLQDTDAPAAQTPPK